MKIQKRGHENRKQKAREFWLRVGTDYASGMTATQIAARYKNPVTGKNYTPEHIHLILKQLREKTIEEIEVLNPAHNKN